MGVLRSEQHQVVDISQSNIHMSFRNCGLSAQRYSEHLTISATLLSSNLLFNLKTVLHRAVWASFCSPCPLVSFGHTWIRQWFTGYPSLHTVKVRHLHTFTYIQGHLELLMVCLNCYFCFQSGSIVCHISLMPLKTKNCVHKFEIIFDFLYLYML